MKPATYAPAYAALYPKLAEIAREHGYAMAVHGSMARDLDVCCIPWVDEPSEPQAVVDAITSQFTIRTIGEPEVKKHGRLVYTVSVGFGECAIDLSFMPRLAASQAPAVPATLDDGLTRKQWTEMAERVYLACGDSEDEARRLSRYLATLPDWLSGEVPDPYETALEDIEGRPDATPTASNTEDARSMGTVSEAAEDFDPRASWVQPVTDRAADMLTAYVEQTKMLGRYAEEHYIPEVEHVIEELRAITQAASTGGAAS